MSLITITLIGLIRSKTNKCCMPIWYLTSWVIVKGAVFTGFSLPFLVNSETNLPKQGACVFRHLVLNCSNCYQRKFYCHPQTCYIPPTTAIYYLLTTTTINTTPTAIVSDTLSITNTGTTCECGTWKALVNFHILCPLQILLLQCLNVVHERPLPIFYII